MHATGQSAQAQAQGMTCKCEELQCTFIRGRGCALYHPDINFFHAQLRITLENACTMVDKSATALEPTILCLKSRVYKKKNLDLLFIYLN